MSDAPEAVVVGAGQAGLAASRELTAGRRPARGARAGRVGQTWRERWDSFCLVTPNWTVQLPASPTTATTRTASCRATRSWRISSAMRGRSSSGARRRGRHRARAPDRRRLPARHIGRPDRGPLGGAQQRRLPAPSPPGRGRRPPRRAFPARCRRVPNPADLPDGAVLVVGSGQSGCQIAEELHRRRPPRAPRLRPRALVAALVRRTRPGLVGARDRLPRRAGGHAARARRLGWRPTSWRPDTAAATTCTTGRCTRWGSRWWGTSSAPTPAGRASRRISPRAWPGATNATPSSWTSSGNTWPSTAYPSPRSPEPEPFNADAARAAEPRRTWAR